MISVQVRTVGGWGAAGGRLEAQDCKGTVILIINDLKLFRILYFPNNWGLLMLTLMNIFQLLTIIYKLVLIEKCINNIWV